MKEGDRVTTTIRDVAFGGDGVGVVNGMAIFVPFTVDGDRVLVEVTGMKKKFARGELREILEPSRHRTVPACPYFGHCGGCRYQHVGYLRQLELKERQVREAFSRIGKFTSPPVQSVRPSPRIFNYRGKAEYHVSGGPEKGLEIGFIHVSGSGVVDIGECLLVEDSINRACTKFRKALLAGEERLRGTRLAVWSALPGEEAGTVAAGAGHGAQVARVVGPRRLLVPAGGFFQANLSLVEELVAQVIDLCALTGRETLLDAYCGSGLFALFALPRACRVFCIEGDEEALGCAAANLGAEGKDKARFFAGDVGRVLRKEFVKGGLKADVVVLDPPRTGCTRRALDALAALQPGRIVYVSCNPATQARDCAYLAERGFTLASLHPIDMFPQTGHIEVVGLLERSGR